ncbi:MAG: MATE family efflux transporter [Planctomycetes bacterium]|nr:MATE family efflux transporter [Planctomycetota bacterium]
MSAGSLPRTDDHSWWRRPAGGREVLFVAVPLVVSSVSWTVLTFVDRMFLNWVSGTSMSAAFSAGMVWFAVFCLPLGICTYANTFVSQYHGDGQPEQIGPSMWQSVWVALLSMPLALACVPLAPLIFQLAGHSAKIAQQEILYFQILCAGGPAMLVAQGFSSFYSGRGHTWVVMLVDGVVALLNVALDYVWIFGLAGFPAMGIAGAAWATVASLWLKVAIYLVLVLRRKHREKFNTLSGMRFSRDLFGRLIYYGGPSGVQMVLEVLGFTTFVVLVGRIGAIETEATTMAFSISSFAYMPVWGFGMAATVLVGQHLGENRDDLAARAIWTTLAIALGYMGLLSSLFVLTPNLFLDVFFVHNTATAAEQAAVHAMAAVLLRFVAAYCLFDAMAMVFVSAIKGAGDTRFVLKVSIVMASLLVGLSWLTIEVWQVGIYACWTVVTGWICAMGVVFWLRFLQGSWRSMRVIEQHHHGAVIEPSPNGEPHED